jgi:hypothetical protein
VNDQVMADSSEDSILFRVQNNFLVVIICVKPARYCARDIGRATASGYVITAQHFLAEIVENSPGQVSKRPRITQHLQDPTSKRYELLVESESTQKIFAKYAIIDDEAKHHVRQN